MMYLFATSLFTPVLAWSHELSFPLPGRPPADNRVALVLDGQPISLLADSGSARFFVVYGGWFERQYGRGSCRRHSMTCYFCPVEAPCDDIEQRERFGVRYGGGSIFYQYGSLDLGKSTVRVTFGLIVDHGDANGFAPDGVLGLSFGRPGIPKTFLQQLKGSKVIHALAYSLDFRQYQSGGKLVLGDSGSQSKYTVHLPFTRLPGAHPKLFVPVTSVRIAKKLISGRKAFGRVSERVAPISLNHTVVFMDTGNAYLGMPRAIFDILVEDLKVSADAASPAGRTGEGLWRSAEEPVWMIRSGHVKFLPTIIYSLVGVGGEMVDVKMLPEDYVGSCTVTECKVYINLQDGALVTFGRPFFRAYHAHVDLEKQSMAITRHSRGKKFPGRVKDRSHRKTVARRFIRGLLGCVRKE
ncbi:hypothetical protein FOZ61_009715 [Perkinsus olseni]|uniref:Peptidase A1 domain-containing protein n=1 Tax=Perkinsus olseni TaxID=32597 RepID=A0A7J6LQU9_PEROL|nr:hypothetical protein FOL46_005674 [Perkinsus olseni]KAF4666458.1 hypothetical protein FOZ61_009715 [Perkinsus olseni]